MKKPPIYIRADKNFARLFIPAMFILSICCCVGVWMTDGDDWWIKGIKIFGALCFFLISLFGLVTLVTRRFVYIPAGSGRVDDGLKITLTADEVICEYSGINKTERVRWDEIDRIQVLTTDEGPVVCDVFLVLQNSMTQKGVMLPQDREETKEVFEKVQQWPGFDNKNFVRAMGSAENQWFDVWKK